MPGKHLTSCAIFLAPEFHLGGGGHIYYLVVLRGYSSKDHFWQAQGIRDPMRYQELKTSWPGKHPPHCTTTSELEAISAVGERFQMLLKDLGNHSQCCGTHGLSSLRVVIQSGGLETRFWIRKN